MKHDQERRLIQSTVSRVSHFMVKENIILLKENTPIHCQTNKMRHRFAFFPLHMLKIRKFFTTSEPHPEIITPIHLKIVFKPPNVTQMHYPNVLNFYGTTVISLIATA